MASRRPPLIGFMYLLIVSVIVSHAVRFYTGVAWGDTLEAYAPQPGPVYIGLSGAFWTAVGAMVLWSLNRGKRWARMLFLWASVLYTGWFWLDRLFVQAGTRVNWPFDLLVSVILWIMIATALLHPKHRIDFEREAYERKS